MLMFYSNRASLTIINFSVHKWVFQCVFLQASQVRFAGVAAIPITVIFRTWQYKSVLEINRGSQVSLCACLFVLKIHSIRYPQDWLGAWLSFWSCVCVREGSMVDSGFFFRIILQNHMFLVLPLFHTAFWEFRQYYIDFYGDSTSIMSLAC
jgi:hypothetical protein